MKAILKFAYMFFCISGITVKAKTWQIGASRTYTLPSQVRLLVNDGDTIYLDAGIYPNDATKWTKKNLKFIGLGVGSNRSILMYTGDIPNKKGIFVFETPGTCDNPYLDNIVFDGAQVSDADGGNGAAIRFQAKDITINNCKFMNCQNGVLEGNGAVNNSNVIIRNSEFYNNGYQLQNDPTYSGYEHNIYISASADTLLVTNCYFHHPRGQANSLKTRAQRSFILYNLIDEEATGFGSWEINIAQGGLNIIMGNIIIQGSGSANRGIIGYDAATNALEDFYFVNNTVINNYSGNIKYFNVVPSSGINTFKIYNNIFASVTGANNTFLTGNIPGVLDTSNNLWSTNYTQIGFKNTSALDFNLLATALNVIDKGKSAGITNTGFTLNPGYVYQSFSSSLLLRNTNGSAIDLGAYEYLNTNRVDEDNVQSIKVYPNPSTGIYKIDCSEKNRGYNHYLALYHINGKVLLEKEFIEDIFELNLCNLPSGIYLLQIKTDKNVNTVLVNKNK